MHYYDKIKELTNSLGISLAEVSKVTGVSVYTIKNWNKVEPSISSLLSIANFFDISVDFLIGNSKDPNSHKSDKLVYALKDIRNILDQKIDSLETSDDETKKLGENPLSPDKSC